MPRLFYDHKNRNCDILHSTFFNKMSFKERQAFVFNKDELAKLSDRDKLLMRGYAQNIVERQRAYRFKHPKKNNSTKKK